MEGYSNFVMRTQSDTEEVSAKVSVTEAAMCSHVKKLDENQK